MGFLDKMASMELPEGVDESVREWKDFPAKKWALGEIPEGISGAAWGLNERQTRDGDTWYDFTVSFRIVGAEESVPATDGPFSMLITRLRVAEWDEAKNGPDPDRPNTRLIALANAVFSPGMPKGSRDRYLNTLAVMADLAADAGFDETAYPNDSTRFAAMLALSVGTGDPRPRLLFTARPEKVREYRAADGTMKQTKPRMTLSSFEEASDDNLANRKIVVW